MGNNVVAVLFVLASMLAISSAYQLTNWMSSLRDSKHLGKIAIPGTHDSAAYQLPSPSIGECQDWSIKEQLRNGIRFLDIRIANNNDEDDFELRHGPIFLGSFKDLVMTPVRDFLTKHPRETVLMSIKDEDTLNVDEFERLYIKTANKFYLNGTVYPWTKLGDVRGKIVLVKRYPGGSYYGKGIPWRNSKMVVQDRYKLEPKCKRWFRKRICNPLFGLNFTKKAQLVYSTLVKATNKRIVDKFWVNFASASYLGLYQIKNANVCNRYVRDFFRIHPFTRIGSIIPMDYPNRMDGVVDAIIRSNFRTNEPHRILYSKETDGYWGAWGDSTFCPSDQFVFGYRLRSQRNQGWGDDTALNDVELLCARRGNVGNYTTIQSRYKSWGHFMGYKYCGSNPVIGFNMKIESKQGSGDDTAANKVNLYCQNGGYISASTETSWGLWSAVKKCPSGWAVNGITTRVEDSQGYKDDTALNGIRMFCKPYSLGIDKVLYLQHSLT